MKTFKILSLAIVLSSLLITSCNSVGEKKKSENIGMEKDTSLSTISPSTNTYTIENLPPGVKEFIFKFYSGYTIVGAAFDPLCGGGPAVDVSIKNPGVPNLSLIFKPDGSYVQQEEDVHLSTAPDKIRSALNTNFKTFTAGNQIEKLTLADKSIQYLVNLSNGKNTKEVIFTIDGNIVCEN